MESEGQHHPDGGSTGKPQRRQLRVIPSITSSTAAAPPLHTIAEEINGIICSRSKRGYAVHKHHVLPNK